MFLEQNGRLIREYDHERVWIEPWGANSLRIRASYAEITDEAWALLPAPQTPGKITVTKERATIVNGKIRAEITEKGQIFFYNQHGKLLLNETEDTYQLKYGGRELAAVPGSSDFSVKLRLEADPNEKLFGMGQYQHSFLNLKGCSLELTHRNSQISVPLCCPAAVTDSYGIIRRSDRRISV